MLQPISRKLLIISIITLTPAFYAWPQNAGVNFNPKQQSPANHMAGIYSLKEARQDAFLGSLNTLTHLPPEKDKHKRPKLSKAERESLREDWRKALGLDIFYPYFKAKEIEEWVKEKASITLLDIKGRPQFSDDQIKYTFKVKF